MPLIYGPTGKLLLGPGGKLATNTKCCCNKYCDCTIRSSGLSLGGFNTVILPCGPGPATTCCKINHASGGHFDTHICLPVKAGDIEAGLECERKCLLSNLNQSFETSDFRPGQCLTAVYTLGKANDPGDRGVLVFENTCSIWGCSSAFCHDPNPYIFPEDCIHGGLCFMGTMSSKSYIYELSHDICCGACYNSGSSWISPTFGTGGAFTIESKGHTFLDYNFNTCGNCIAQSGTETALSVPGTGQTCLPGFPTLCQSYVVGSIPNFYFIPDGHADPQCLIDTGIASYCDDQSGWINCHTCPKCYGVTTFSTYPPCTGPAWNDLGLGAGCNGTDVVITATITVNT